MAQQLRALATFAEDSGLAPSTHMMPSQPPLGPVAGDSPLLTSTGPRDACTWRTFIHAGKTLIHKIIFNYKYLGVSECVHMHSHTCEVHMSAGMYMIQYSHGSQRKTTSSISPQVPHCSRQAFLFSAAYTRLARLQTSKDSVSTSHLDSGAL